MTRIPGSRPVRTAGPAPRPGPRPRGSRPRPRPHDELTWPPRSHPPRRGRTPTTRKPSVSRTNPALRTFGRFVARLGMGVVILAVFVFGVFPTGRYVEQREELDRARVELAELLEENRQLEDRIDRLESDAEIERVARSEYDMVYPDEEVYAVLPPAGG